ncbi:MAG: hypothetical protein HY722_17260 [Planctomycetes bacterium]|nr:hypothetical protein [Planctomycetota bacterium]
MSGRTARLGAALGTLTRGWQVLAGFLLATLLVAAVAFAFSARSNPVWRQRLSGARRVLRGDAVSFPDEAAQHVRPASLLERFDLLVEGSEGLEAARRGVDTVSEQARLEQQAFEHRKHQFELRVEELARDLDAREQALVREREAHQARVEAERAALEEAGFRRNLALFSKMKAEDVASAVWPLPDSDIGRYLMNIKERQAAEVLAALVTRAAIAPEGPDGDRERVARILATMERRAVELRGSEGP